MTHIKYLLNCKKFISLMILFSFFDNFGMDTHSTKLKDVNEKFVSSDNERNAKSLNFQVGFVGASGVGKTNIISRFVCNSFNGKYLPTLGVISSPKTVKINGLDIFLLFWDAPEKLVLCDRVQRIFGSFDLLVYVYAVDDRNSFEKVKNFFLFYPELNPKIESWLVGNKIDVGNPARVVTTDEGKNYAKENGMAFFEVSAKTETGLKEDFFNSFITKLLDEGVIKEQSLRLGYNNRNSNSIISNSSFCDECCSCCPCFKNSEELDCSSSGI